MRGGHDSNPSTVAAGALGTRPVPASAVNPPPSPHELHPPAYPARNCHISRDRAPIKAPPQGWLNPRCGGCRRFRYERSGPGPAAPHRALLRPRHELWAARRSR